MCIAIGLLFLTVSLLQAQAQEVEHDNDRHLINHWFFNDTSASAIPGTPFNTRFNGNQHQSQSPEDGLCSCSPRAYDFRLNFNAGCNVDTLADNTGVDGSICFFTKGGSPDDVNTGDIGFPGAGRSGRDATGGDRGVRGLRAENDRSSRWKHLQEKIPFSIHYKHATKIQRQRLAQGFDTTPTIITSVTFLEFDSDIEEIINQDSTYFETVLGDGNIISYPSISSQMDTTQPLSNQLELLPGAVMLVLFGVNKDNTVVQNTVAWGYNLTECSGEPLTTEDAIGWTSLEAYIPPKAAFCPAVTDMPTVSPSGGIPTTASPNSSPIAGETPSSTVEPVPDMTATGSPMNQPTIASTSDTDEPAVGSDTIIAPTVTEGTNVATRPPIIQTEDV